MAKEVKKEVKEEIKKETPKEEVKDEKLTKKDIKVKAEEGMTLDEIKKENRRIKRRSSTNRFFATLFLLILFYIFGVVSGVYFADKYNVTLFDKNGKEIKIDDKKDIEECTIVNCEKVTFKGTYTGSVYENESNEGNKLTVTLELDENGYASLTSDINGEVVEVSSGTYEVNEKKLTYNRIYAKGGNDQNDNTYLIKIGASSNAQYKYSNIFDNSRSTETFTINDNTFTLDGYAKAVMSTNKFIELSK